MSDRKKYWITPPEIFESLDEEFEFDFDPCPYPWNGVDGTEIDWGDIPTATHHLEKQTGKTAKDQPHLLERLVKRIKKEKQ